jgi:carbonic anhydrase/acetyltransferase-like protein (isoleucine patch superfamily)
MTLYTLDEHGVETPGPGQYWVAPNATVLGKVRLELDVSVWFNAVLRGDNELIHLHEGVSIQDGCVLHTDIGYPLTVETTCTIGHMAMLHGCTVKRGSLVGIGATILNGCVIGEESLIGAHAFLPEGKEIPPRSLVVGTPGRVVRQLSDDEVAGIQEKVRDYRANWKRFAAGLLPQA